MLIRTIFRYISTLTLVTIFESGSINAAPLEAFSLENILGEIEALEGENDPKCYATASRLEDFMFGTPLNAGARNSKNDLQKDLVTRIWQAASTTARAVGDTEVSAAHSRAAIATMFVIEQSEEGHWTIEFPNQRLIRIEGRDKRQYGSIAYSLRAILAVQQQSRMDPDSDLLPLSRESVNLIKEATDLFTLSVLKIADETARAKSSRELKSPDIESVWTRLLPGIFDPVKQPPLQPVQQRNYSDLALTNAVIGQKVRSYAKYNEISNQLFVRNLQVYFAKQRWPESGEEAQIFRQLFTETLIEMARDIYLGAQATALARDSALIQERDVGNFMSQYMPHKVNQYEDAIFFPRLPRQQQVVIESYDMDAFRDSGIHWRYLQFAIQSDGFRAYLEPDPFALELMTEGIAQLGVLLLRLTGDIGAGYDQKRIASNHLAEAAALFHSRTAANNVIKPESQAEQMLKSATGSQSRSETNLFTEISGSVGIDYMHRSSDWLSRLLRSYLRKDENTGIITIPPAFGGSGVAVGDINNDGHPDVLLLGGLGNRLFVNRGTGHFDDITERAGLNWVRPDDRNPGEPRQPLIADLDNDGHQDIVITYVDDDHRVYRNNGDETFTDMTGVAKLGGKDLVGGPATVFDFDNDGLLDIYVTYFGNYIRGVLPSLKRRNYNGLPNKLFRNRGQFLFEDVTEKSGLDNSGWAQAVTHTDIDGDGLQDVIVGNDFGINSYYLNQGNGSFVDVADKIGTDKPSYTMGIGIADLNADLMPDFYISNIVTMNKDQKYVLPSAETAMVFNPEKLANMRVVEANDLFLSHSKSGELLYLPSDAVERGYSSTGWSWGAEFFDSDNDGDDDLYVLNGMNEYNLYSSENPYYTDPLDNQKRNIHIPVDTKETNVFFINQGGRLNNVSNSSGLDLRSNSRSAAYLDYDGDGDLDIVMNNYHEAARFYRNDAAPTDNSWIKIKLVGSPSRGINRDAIGARLIARSNDGTEVWREIRGSSGYMTVQAREQHIGLGNSESVDLEITWPNGERQTVSNLKSRQSIVIEYDTNPPQKLKY